jgi:soluble lytic murein transglycosylase-like protein
MKPQSTQSSLRALRGVVLLAAALAATTASAQQPRPPVQSTELTVDFSRPDETAKPEVPEKPKDVATSDESRPHNHTCTTGDLAVDAMVRDAGLRYGVDPCLIVAVMAAESGYRRYAVSPKGACGYMQLMPATAARFGVADLFDARQNIQAGTRYLRFLLDRFGGSLELALAGYNAGEGAVERYGKRVPPFSETQNYVRIISSRYLTRHAGAIAYRPSSAAPPAPVASLAAANRPTVAWRISVSFEEQ